MNTVITYSEIMVSSKSFMKFLEELIHKIQILMNQGAKRSMLQHKKCSFDLCKKVELHICIMI